MKTKHKLAAAGALVLGLAVFGTAATQAAENTTRNKPMHPLVSAISQKFNLNSSDVQKAFDEQHKEMSAARKQEASTRFTAMLAKAVTSGKLTQIQADAITAKKAELEASHEANRTTNQTLTKEQRAAKMKTEKESLKAWATANNIPTEYSFFFGGPMMGGNGGPGFGQKMGMKHSPKTTTTQ